MFETLDKMYACLFVYLSLDSAGDKTTQTISTKFATYILTRALQIQSDFIGQVSEAADRADFGYSSG